MDSWEAAGSSGMNAALLTFHLQAGRASCHTLALTAKLLFSKPMFQRALKPTRMLDLF